MLSIITVFLVSLLGLAALFVCKTLELGRNIRTPLTALRRVGDPMLTEGWTQFSTRFKTAARAGLHASILWVGTAARKAEIAFDVTVHAIAARLNRYLRTRRFRMRHGSEVSAHLKTVLEKTEKDTRPPPIV